MQKKCIGAVFLITLTLLTVRCTTELPEPDEIQSRNQIVSINEVPGLLQAIAPYINPSLSDRGNISSANQGETYFGMNIDFENIIARIDTMDFTNYSFLLEDGDYDPTTFINLVVGKDANGQYKIPKLIRYEMSPEFGSQYLRTGSLEGFSGIIKKAQLSPMNGPQNQNSRTTGSSEDPDDYGSDRDQPNTTCPLETAVSSGGSTQTTSTGGTLYEVCEVSIVTVYSTDGHGNRYIWDTYLVYENCRTVEIYSSSDSSTCEDTEGEIPVNPSRIDEEDPCKTSAEDIGKAFPNATEAAKDSLESIINEYADKFGIDSKEKLQHFLGQAGHESGGFTDLARSEGLYYTTAARLVEVWPSKFSLTDTVNKANPNNYLRDSKKLANFVYADRNGNANEASGDGYEFRGRGIFQLTGRSNYQAFTDFYQDEFISTDSLITDPDKIGTDDRLAIISALWYFKTQVLDKITVDDDTSVSDVTKKINPAEEGIDDRKTKTEAAEDHIDDCEE